PINPSPPSRQPKGSAKRGNQRQPASRIPIHNVKKQRTDDRGQTSVASIAVPIRNSHGQSPAVASSVLQLLVEPESYAASALVEPDSCLGRLWWSRTLA